MKIFQYVLALFALYLSAGFTSCEFGGREEYPQVVWDTLQVTASAYNSLDYQGEGAPNVTAWGDTIAPGDKVIAVSRDLINRGLTYNTIVKIEGFDGVFFVKDKMHHRWNNKIDIYMGEDVREAREFGRKKLEIYVAVENDSLLRAEHSDLPKSN